MHVTVWTVNERADIARMIAMGVDGIASDYPDRVLNELKGK
jgi:glycerophosphoryl diester phosphodiesterase